jgi:hypothetical protein
MKTMKKILAIVLAVVMAFSCSALAFAADTATPADVPAASSILDSIQGILSQITGILQQNNVLDTVKGLIEKITALVQNLTGGNTADVLGVADELEAKIAAIPVLGDVYEFLHNLITTLKQKIKDLYAGNCETEPEETTAAEEPSDTGSTAIGLAAFASFSVAAAAAYVCTKKKVA